MIVRIDRSEWKELPVGAALFLSERKEAYEEKKSVDRRGFAGGLVFFLFVVGHFCRRIME